MRKTSEACLIYWVHKILHFKNEKNIRSTNLGNLQ